jgi:2,4-diketo-3-deoxy-L-fuconate hydrolase
LILVDAEGRSLDVASASGIFSADPQAVYDRWDEFRSWATTCSADHGTVVALSDLDAVVPRPRQVFAIALNYRELVAETGFDLPSEPVVFTKYVSSFTGPAGRIALSPGDVDWEVELVAVIGHRAWRVSENRGWSHIAGLTIGLDISDRTAQFAAPPAQFGMAKSYPGYSPIGPFLVTPDEFGEPDDLEIGCAVNDEVMQKGRTSGMIFGVAELVSRLSARVELLPGDVIFTGTLAGIGMERTPPRFLAHRDRLTSWITGIGEMHHEFTRP